MKTLLVPTDFSEASLNAFQHAIKLARHIGGQIKVAHVYYDEEFAGDVLAPSLIDTAFSVKNNLKTFGFEVGFIVSSYFQ